MNYEEMQLLRPIKKAVKEAGYQALTPIQEATIPLVLAGKDVIGCAQTGTGKTAAFALPILQQIACDTGSKSQGRRPIRALVVTATRELTIQNYECFRSFSKYLPLRVAAIYGGVNQASQVEALKRGVDILAATPGRLNDLIGQGYIDLSLVKHFVLDEADRMLDMGFIHDVRRILTYLPKERQTLLFSATMPQTVEALARTFLRDPASVKVDPVTSAAETVSQSVCYLQKADKREALLYLLKELGRPATLVFTRTKHGADQVTRNLCKSGIPAMAIHGNKSQNARQTALSKFKAGQIEVLVATDIAARGIDILELPLVINYNISEEPETYIHRIGRTGRAGQSGRAISLCCSDELEDWRDTEKLIGNRVPELETPWSVADMKPTKPEKQAGRGNRSASKQHQPVATQAGARKSAGNQRVPGKNVVKAKASSGQPIERRSSRGQSRRG